MKSIFKLMLLVPVSVVLSACFGGAENNGIVPGAPPPPPIVVSAIDAGSVSEGILAAVLSFEFQLSDVSIDDIDVSYVTRSGTATSGEDFIERSGTATIAAGQLSASINVTIIGDFLDEPDETVFVEITSISAGEVGVSSGVGTILDDDFAPSISIADGSLTEGDNGQTNLAFQISLSAASGFDIALNYSTANESATAGLDYIALSGQLTILAGASDVTIDVDIIGDVVDEENETFSVTLDALTNVVLGDGTATGTIVDDDDTAPPLVTVSIAAAENAAENPGGSALTFPVSLSMASSSDVTVQYQTAAGTASPGFDFVAQSSSIVIPAGQLNGAIVVAIIDDLIDEPSESMSVGLTSVSSGVVGAGTAGGTIIDDDPPPTISVANASIGEGDSGQSSIVFPITLSRPSAFDISVNFQSSDGTAEAGFDYSSTSGTTTINAGDIAASILVSISGDTTFESDETLGLSLSTPTNVVIGVASAIGTITNDDSEPTISIADASIAEGDAGQMNLAFAVTLSSLSSADVTFSYASSDGSATAGSDYVGTSSNGTITAGNVTVDVTVPINGDIDVEPDETFTVTLSGVTNASLSDASAIGTITNDDSEPTISIADASIAEGDAGQMNLAFAVTLSSLSSADVTFSYASSDGSATAGSDYVGTSSNGTITAGNVTVDVTVPINGDIDVEPDETFTVTLSGVTNASLSDASAIGTITNDDSEPTISIADASIAEGDAGQMNLAFAVTLSSLSSADVTFSYASSDGSATAGSDYVGTSSNGTITAGNVTVDVTVPINGDIDVEPDETFTVTLSGVTNASLSDASAIGTITNDDSEPTISIADASIAEGDAGQMNLAFAVTLSSLSSADVTFSYASSDGSATAGSDYVGTSSNGTITAGNVTVDVTVPINGDIDVEPDETFTVTLSGVTNASLSDASAIGTITNDDSSLQSGLTSRPSNFTCLATDQPIINTSIATEEAFPNLPGFVKPVVLLQAPNDASQWFVVEQDGRVLRFADSAASSSASVYIDIRSSSDPIDVDSGSSEAGLLGMAFHPNYGNGNWYVYLSYMIDGAGTGQPFVSVVSRFESKDSGQTLDATDATEVLRINQPFNNHNGGQASFGPDGYLYIQFGDGGAGGDPGDRAQNTNNLFGSLLRIDVDGPSPYAIPGDNPFAGNGLCNTGFGGSSCPEIYAWGLRNPWKSSFDDATGQLWLADVGQNTIEEVNIIELGGNYGWRCKEGTINFDTSGVCPSGLVDPVMEYSHSTGSSITGGEIYRGNAIPELDGRYVFADYVAGKIFVSVDNGSGSYDWEQLLDTSHLISAFAHEQNGELLYLNYGSGDIRRIVQSGGNSNDPIPDQLSATGCVNAANPSLPAVGLIPYDVNALFWSDGAAKERWYAIPDGTTIDVAADGDWQFPVGSVLVKNFRLNNTLIETRLFMRHTNGEWGGYTYEWNGAGTGADRVVGGKQVTKAGQEWIYPSGAECMQCHTQAAGFSLGIEHGQLNGDLTYPSSGLTGNQLYTADFVDLLTNPLGDTPANLPRFVDPTNTGESLESRARAYLHTNCAGCHRPGGPTPSGMDLRHATPLAGTNTCDAIPTSGDLGISGARLVDPGSAATSLVVERASRRDSHRMPPLGSNLIDSQGVQLLADWVNSLAACP